MLGKNKKTAERSRQSAPKKSKRNVFSYYTNNRSVSDNERARNDTFDLQTKKTNRNLRHVPTYLALIIILFSIGYSLILDVANPKVVALSETTPSILRPNDQYQSGIADIFSRSLSARTKISINTKSIEGQVLQQYPELGSVSINIPMIGKRLIVEVSPTTPSFVLSAQTGTYIVGDNGKALMKTADLSQQQSASLLRVKDQLGAELDIGMTVLPISTVDFIQSLQDYCDRQGINIDYIELPAVANELHVHIQGLQYVVKLNLQNDVREQVGAYVALLQNLKQQAKPEPTQYIDVRITGRAYYK